MNRKTMPVSKLALRRRALINVARRLQDIADQNQEREQAGLYSGVGEMASGQIRDMDRGQKRDLASGDMGDLAPGEVRDLAPGEVRDLAPGEVRDLAPGEVGDLAPGEMDDVVYDSDDFYVEANYSFESESENENIQDSLLDRVTNWAIHFKISLVALTALLAILRVYHSGLPKDARTLLKTRTDYVVVDKAGGQYHYFGILNSLTNTLSKCINSLANNTTLKFHINIDGLPLFKSSSIQMWPILALLVSVPMKEPAVVALFSGPKKPNSPHEYLLDFVTELKYLENGFEFGDKTLKLKLDAVICDTPARSFVKNTKGHNAYHGCDKCVEPGKYVNNRMTFENTDSPLRTDASFEDMVDDIHHRQGPNPFLGCQIGMVTGFPLDYMHLVCLGVMRRLLSIWLRGSLNFRIPANIVEIMSQKLIDMRPYIPVEFSRKQMESY